MCDETRAIGKRKFAGDFRRKIWMFDHLVKSIIMYGAKIWGWKEYEEIEKCQGKFIKWLLRLDCNTPGYILGKKRKELMRIESGKRTIQLLSIEERFRKKLDNKILIQYLREIERNRENKMKLELEREMYFRRNEMSGIEVKI